MDEKRTYGSFRIGTVTLVDNGFSGTQKHQVAYSPLESRDSVPAVTPYGFYNWPHVGAQTLALHAAGDQSKGVVITVHDQRYRMTLGAEGEVAIADDLGQTVHLTRSGIIVNGGGNQVTITNTPTVRMESTLNVTKDVIANCDGVAISLLKHKHPTAEPGAPSEPIT